MAKDKPVELRKTIESMPVADRKLLDKFVPLLETPEPSRQE